jgi:Tfp pilus assembly protein PilF
VTLLEASGVTESDLRESRAIVHVALEKMKQNQFAQARADLENALRVAPEEPLALSYYGLCLAQIGELGRGLGVCERAVRNHPSDVMIRVNMGKVFRLAGDNHAAHRTFLRAWQVNRRHPAPAAELARMGIRRAPVLRFLPRSHWCNRQLGRLRYHLERAVGPRVAY